MADRAAKEQANHTWYTRPVLFVADIGRSIRFYTEGLGFRKAWHEADGKGTVCQVERGGCEIILCEDGGRRDKARLFVSLTKRLSRRFGATSRTGRSLARCPGGATT